MDPLDRYLPAGMIDDQLNLTAPDESKILEYIDHSYYNGTGGLNPRQGETDPNYKPAVKTGDDSNTTLWVMLLTVSALLAAAVVVLPRKKHTR